MDTILENREHLSFNWHPGCVYHSGTSSDGRGNYSVGPIGRRGPGVTDAMIEEAIRKHVKPPIPSSLEVYIAFKNTATTKLIDDIVSGIKELNKTEDIHIKYIPYRCVTTMRVKKEFEEEDRKARAAHEEKEKAAYAFLSKFEELGGDVEDAGFPSYQTPEEWKEVESSKNDVSYAQLSVCCHSGTVFYQSLLKAGILDEAYPKWYAEGKY